MGFKKATRENIFVKVCTIGASGSGKSYGNLRMATGFAQALSKKNGVEERIAYIGTEGSRDKYYASEFDYDLMQLKGDFSPETYDDALDEAIDAGYKIIIIDSITPEWVGKNGCLEIHSKISGNSYTAWNKVTPRHNKFMDKILDSEAHIFVTVKGKDKYVMEEVNGKQVIKKLNLGYQQRDDLEYLFSLSLNIEQDTHLFTAVKDNTHIFEDRNDILNEKDGTKLFEWSTNGDIKAKLSQLEKAKQEGKDKIAQSEEEEVNKILADKSEKVKEDKKLPNTLKNKKTETVEAPTLEDLKVKILGLCKDLAVKGKRDEAVSTLKDLDNGNANPKSITDVKIAEEIFTKLTAIK